MKTYEYRGFDRAGHACKGLVEALSVKNAREKLAGDGILAERLSLTGRRLKLGVETRTMIYRELSALLGAGVPLEKALDVMIQSPELRDSHVLLAGVRDRVREGASFADALSEASESVSSFETAIIEAAEESATVDVMLDRLASFLEDQEKLRERIQGALLYPVIVFTVGICVAILMLGLLLPRARDMFTYGDTSLPALTSFMIGSGEILFMWGLPFVGVIICVALYVRRRLKHDSNLAGNWNRALFRIPFIGRGYTILVNLRFARTMAILLNGGVSLIDGMILSGRATGSIWVADITEKEAESVRHGGTLSDALRRIPPLSESLPGWIQIGEASGGLERLLNNVGDRYQNYWNRFIGRCLAFVEPLLILLIGGFVLLVTLSILLPVLSLSETLGK